MGLLCGAVDRRAELERSLWPKATESLASRSGRLPKRSKIGVVFSNPRGDEGPEETSYNKVANDSRRNRNRSVELRVGTGLNGEKLREFQG